MVTRSQTKKLSQEVRAEIDVVDDIKVNDSACKKSPRSSSRNAQSKRAKARSAALREQLLAQTKIDQINREKFQAKRKAKEQELLFNEQLMLFNEQLRQAELVGQLNDSACKKSPRSSSRNAQSIRAKARSAALREQLLAQTKVDQINREKFQAKRKAKEQELLFDEQLRQAELEGQLNAMLAKAYVLESKNPPNPTLPVTPNVSAASNFTSKVVLTQEVQTLPEPKSLSSDVYPEPITVPNQISELPVFAEDIPLSKDVKQIEVPEEIFIPNIKVEAGLHIDSDNPVIPKPQEVINDPIGHYTTEPVVDQVFDCPKVETDSTNVKKTTQSMCCDAIDSLANPLNKISEQPVPAEDIPLEIFIPYVKVEAELYINSDNPVIPKPQEVINAPIGHYAMEPVVTQEFDCTKVQTRSTNDKSFLVKPTARPMCTMGCDVNPTKKCKDELSVEQSEFMKSVKGSILSHEDRQCCEIALPVRDPNLNMSKKEVQVEQRAAYLKRDFQKEPNFNKDCKIFANEMMFNLKKAFAWISKKAFAESPSWCSRAPPRRAKVRKKKKKQRLVKLD